MASSHWIANDSTMHQGVYSERDSLGMDALRNEVTNPENRNGNYKVRRTNHIT